MISLKKMLYKLANIDYVIETGTSGDYTYKKWRSGICEAWHTSSKSATLNQTVGKWYYGDATTTGSVASGLFYSTVVETVGVYCTSTSGNGFVVGGSTVATTTSGGSHNVASGQSRGTSYTYKANFHLYGKWKSEVTTI